MKKAIIFTILAILMLAGVFTFFFFSKFNHIKINKSDEALGISKQEIIDVDTNNQSKPLMDLWGKYHFEKLSIGEKKESEPEPEPEYQRLNNVVNIALFGVDSREANKKGRSDSIIIASIDFETKKIKLSSLMRDMYVPIDGHGKTKLNHAYAYGGAPLAIKTINQNFGTDIRDYVTVDFFTLGKIIDIIGGVKIDIKQKEIEHLNGLISEVANIEKVKPVFVTKPGEQMLNGQQAVAYSRIRYIGNGDFERTDRQKRVLSAMIEKLKVEMQDTRTLPKMIAEIMPLVETSLEVKTILNLGMNYLKTDGMTIEQERFPVDGYFSNDMSTGVFYFKIDDKATKQQIVDYIFRDIRPTPKR